MLTKHGATPSTPSVRYSYDTALAEAVNGLHKTKLTYLWTWTGITEVELVTMEWVHRRNPTRLHQALGHRYPSEAINAYGASNAKTLTCI